MKKKLKLQKALKNKCELEVPRGASFFFYKISNGHNKRYII